MATYVHTSSSSRALSRTSHEQSAPPLPAHQDRAGISGHTILEALIATAMTAIIGAGLWQLVHSTRSLVERSFHTNQPDCDAPSCTDTTRGAECRCGDRVFVMVR